MPLGQNPRILCRGMVASIALCPELIAMYVGAYRYIIDSFGDHAAVALSSIGLAHYSVTGGMDSCMTRSAYISWSLTPSRGPGTDWSKAWG